MMSKIRVFISIVVGVLLWIFVWRWFVFYWVGCFVC